ncbi:hypothetical protein ACFX11_003624 [Malus domestica]
MNKGGKKISSPPAQEMSVEKKMKISSVAHKGPPAAERPVIDLTSSNGKKNKAARSEHVGPSMSRMASTIADRITQRRGPIMPLVLKSVPIRPLGAKSGSPLERLAIMKSDKVDSTTKVVPRPTPLATKTDSPTGKEKTARVGSCEKSIKPASGEAAEICTLLKPELLEDMDACAKFVDDIIGIICPSLFTKYTTKYMKTVLLTMMQKTAILVAESMLIDQEDTKTTKEVAKAVADEDYFYAEKVERLASEFVALKGYISILTSLQLEIARQ